MHLTRWSGKRWGRGKPFVRWHRHILAVGVSFSVGSLAAVIAALSSGGCGAALSDEGIDGLGGMAGSGTDSALQGDVATSKEAEGDGMPPEYRVNLTFAFVHASANLWSFRLCLMNKDSKQFVNSLPLPSDPNAVMPHSNKVGVAPGSALVIHNAESIFKEGTTNVEPYLIRVDRLVQGNEKRGCAELLNLGNSYLLAEDFVAFPSISVSTMQGDTVALFAVHGCLADNKIGPERCGGDPADLGNLAIQSYPTWALPEGDPDAGMVRVRGAHLSESADSVLVGDAGGGGKLVLRYGPLVTPDLGELLLDGQPFLSLAPESDAVEISMPDSTEGGLAQYQERGFTLHSPSQSGGTTQPLTLSLADVQDLSDTPSTPPAFWNSATDFLVTLVGDATGKASQLQVDGGDNPFFDGYGLHLIALPLRLRAQADASTDP